MTDYKDLTALQRIYLLKYWFKEGITEPKTGNLVVSSAGDVVNVTAVPSDTELQEFKNKLIVMGGLDPVFGRALTIDDNELLPFIGDRNDLTGGQEEYGLRSVSAKNEAYRKIGFTEEEYNNRQIQLAVTKPKEFLDKKNKDIEDINKRSFTVYGQAYDKYRTFGYSEDDAFMKAKKAANAFKDKLMDVHREEYPEKLARQATDKISQNVV